MRARHRAHPGQMPALPDQPLFPGGRDIKYKHCFLVDAYIEAYEEGGTLPDRQLEVLNASGFQWIEYTTHGEVRKYKPGASHIGAISGRAMALAMALAMAAAPPLRCTPCVCQAAQLHVRN